MKILLTGATGFLGSHLLRGFLFDGHEVAAIKRSASSLERVKDIAHEVAWYNHDEVELTAPFQRHSGFEAVIHTSTCYGRSEESRSSIFEANTFFPLRLLDVATSFNTNTFFNTDTFFNTEIILSPYLSNYALSKKHFAEWGRMIAASEMIRFVNIRLEQIYGPGDANSKFCTDIIRQCLQDLPEIRLTGGEQKRDFIFVNDVVEAYRLLMLRIDELPNGFVEIGLGSGNPTRVRDFVELIHRFCKSSSYLHFGALPYRENEIMESSANNNILKELGWSCTYNLSDGIGETIKYIKKYL